MVTPYTKINPKWFNNFNVRHDTIKLLEENKSKTFWHKSYLWSVCQGNRSKKVKINKWDLIKLTSFLHRKGTCKQNKKTTYITGESTCKWHTSLISKIHTWLTQFSNKTTNNPTEIWAEELDISQRRHTDGQQEHEKKLHIINCWASLVAQMVKNPPAMQETQVWSLGRENFLEKGMATHSSILTWKTPWTEEQHKTKIHWYLTSHWWEWLSLKK